MKLTDTFIEVSLDLALGSAFQSQYLRTEERPNRLLVAIFTNGLEIAWGSVSCGPPTVWMRKTTKPKEN